MGLVPDNPPVRGCLSSRQKVRHRRAYQRSPQTYASIAWDHQLGLHQRPDARWKIKCVRSPAELWWCVCRYAVEEAAAAPDSLIGLRYPASRTVCRSALWTSPMPGIAPSPVPYAMGISFRWPHQNDGGQAARHHPVKGGIRKESPTACPPSRRGKQPALRARLKGGTPTAVIRHPLWDDTIFSHFFGCLT